LLIKLKTKTGDAVKFAKLMKQAQEMQQKFGRVQEELGQLELEGSAGGGMVKAVVSGKKELVSLRINPEVVDKNEVGMLEELVVAAVRQAGEKAEAAARERMTSLTGGLSLPGLGI
jgi:DNA-binding YbaB/EbfC family protein